MEVDFLSPNLAKCNVVIACVLRPRPVCSFVKIGRMCCSSEMTVKVEVWCGEWRV